MNRLRKKNTIQVVKINTLLITRGEYPLIVALREKIRYRDQLVVAPIKKRFPGKLPDTDTPFSIYGRRAIIIMPRSPTAIPVIFRAVNFSPIRKCASIAETSGIPV